MNRKQLVVAWLTVLGLSGVCFAEGFFGYGGRDLLLAFGAPIGLVGGMLFLSLGEARALAREAIQGVRTGTLVLLAVLLVQLGMGLKQREILRAGRDAASAAGNAESAAETVGTNVSELSEKIDQLSSNLDDLSSDVSALQR